jgi:hypothetical protein
MIFIFLLIKLYPFDPHPCKYKGAFGKTPPLLRTRQRRTGPLLLDVRFEVPKFGIRDAKRQTAQSVPVHSPSTMEVNVLLPE